MSIISRISSFFSDDKPKKTPESPFAVQRMNAVLPLRNRFLVTGAKSSGKTSFVFSLSDSPIIEQDIFASSPSMRDPEIGDVYVDYGEIRVDDDHILEIYATPGQRRFAFMWRILCKRAMGAVVLVDNTRPDPVADLLIYLENFSPLLPNGHRSLAVGVKGLGLPGLPSLASFQERLPPYAKNLPIVACDPSKRSDALFLLQIVSSASTA